jgi:hypothetical protein
MELANVDGVVVRVEWFTPLLSKMTANTAVVIYCVNVFLLLTSGVELCLRVQSFYPFYFILSGL